MQESTWGNQIPILCSDVMPRGLSLAFWNHSNWRAKNQTFTIHRNQQACQNGLTPQLENSSCISSIAKNTRTSGCCVKGERWLVDFFLFEMQKWEKEQISLKQHYVAITRIGDVCTTTVAWSRNLKWFLRLICEIKAGGFKNSFNHVRKQQSPVLKQLEGSTWD